MHCVCVCVQWDTENPHDIPPIIEANVNANCTGVLFCYDVCNMQSFQDIEHWMNAVDRCVVVMYMLFTVFGELGSDLDFGAGQRRLL